MVVRGPDDGSDSDEIVGLASVADELGYRELWIGEGPIWDAFALATAVGSATRSASLTVGPVAVSVRDPATISRGAASVARLTGRKVGVALGTASVRVVEKLHGRSRRRSVTDLRESAQAIRGLVDTPADRLHSGDPDAEFLSRLAAPNGPLTVAAFGDRAIQVAADYADRMLLDLVTPEQVIALRSRLEAAVGSNAPPSLAAWLPAVVEPSAEALQQVKADIAGYLTVGGYREMFIAAGFEEAVARADSGADVGELIESLPVEAPAIVGLVGDESDVGERLQAYADAGLDEVAVVPVRTGPDGQRTLRALRSLV
ncbi:MAG TPA: LLM class F420-dependent oxidoreductase [Acidimicrobiia bacterium]